MYKHIIVKRNDELVVDASCIKRISDNAIVPFDEANKDYQKYLEWLAEGNTPEPTDE